MRETFVKISQTKLVAEEIERDKRKLLSQFRLVFPRADALLQLHELIVTGGELMERQVDEDKARKILLRDSRIWQKQAVSVVAGLFDFHGAKTLMRSALFPKMPTGACTTGAIQNKLEKNLESLQRRRSQIQTSDGVWVKLD